MNYSTFNKNVFANSEEYAFEKIEYDLYHVVNATSIDKVRLHHMVIKDQTRLFFKEDPWNGLERFKLFCIKCSENHAKKMGIAERIDFDYWRNQINIWSQHGKFL